MFLQVYQHESCVYRVIISNDTVYSCGRDRKLKVWSILNNQLLYEITFGNSVYDLVIGREGTPLANRIVSLSREGILRISAVETGDEVKTIKFDKECFSMAVDESQTVIAVGTRNSITFIDSTNYTKVKGVSFNYRIDSPEVSF